MKIVYFEPLTLIDYPGKIAAIAFTPGCVFRCPFCHSPELVVPDKTARSALAKNREAEFFDLLRARRGKVDGVVVTGGEPTLHHDLVPFLMRVKAMGFAIKLDTNGIFPDAVEKILDADVVDYWAMDIKHTPEKYALATGVPVDSVVIDRSRALIMERAEDYEFRTTVVPGIHTANDIRAMAQWIRGARRYYLQAFRDIKLLNDDLRYRAAHAPAIDLDDLHKEIAQEPYGLGHVGVRR